MAGTFPQGRNAYYDPLLSNFATMNFDKGAEGFIADQIAPAVPVDKQSGYYRIFDKEAWMRVPEDLRAPLSAPNQITFTTSSDNFFADNRALSAPIPLETLANADRALNIRQNHSDLLVLTLRRSQEDRVARLVTASGGPGTIVQAAGAGTWDSVNSADILGQVNSAHIAIWKQTGLRPNTVVCDWESILLAQRNTLLLQTYKSQGGGEVPIDRLMREVFKVQRLIIADGIKNTGVQGTSFAGTSIWGNVCLFMVSNPLGSDVTPNFLTRFRWNPSDSDLPYKVGGDSLQGLQVFRSVYNRAGEAKVEVLETGYYQDEKITGSELAYLLKTK